MREPYVATTCVHYRSTHAACRANVDVRDLVDADGRVPCVVIRGITGQKPCNLLELITGDAPGEAGPMAKMLTALLDAKCPKCGAQINGQMEFNDAILAMPCRHVLRSSL